jgi:thioesterase domain-containing protein
MLETYWAAITAHVPRPYAGRAALFKARTRKLFSRRQADDLGWSQFIHGPLTVVEVPGSHESVLREPFVQALAAAIRLTVDEAAAPAGVPECDIGWSGSALEASTADGN